jgi:hypothetical protein
MLVDAAKVLAIFAALLTCLHCLCMLLVLLFVEVDFYDLICLEQSTSFGWANSGSAGPDGVALNQNCLTLS